MNASNLPQSPIVLENGVQPKEGISHPWLWFFAALGSALVVISFVLALRYPNVHSIWPTASLQFGATILLFTVLFYAERRLIRRVVRETTDHLVRALKPNDPVLNTILNDAQTTVNAEAGKVALDWFEAVRTGDIGIVWELSEYNWRLCRAQARLWNSRELLGLSDPGEINQIANDLATFKVDHPWKGVFLNYGKRELQDAIPGKVEWGMPNRRRCVGPGYELHILAPLHGEFRHGMEIHTPSLMPGSQFILTHLTADVWKVAAFNAEAPPHPGLPPAWWVKYDPAAEIATDQLILEQHSERE